MSLTARTMRTDGQEFYCFLSDDLSFLNGQFLHLELEQPQQPFRRLLKINQRAINTNTSSRSNIIMSAIFIQIHLR